MTLKLLDICLLVGTEMDRILRGMTHKPSLPKKSWARAVWNNNLMLAAAWTGCQLRLPTVRLHTGRWAEVARARVSGKQGSVCVWWWRFQDGLGS